MTPSGSISPRPPAPSFQLGTCRPKRWGCHRDSRARGSTSGSSLCTTMDHFRGVKAQLPMDRQFRLSGCRQLTCRGGGARRQRTGNGEQGFLVVAAELDSGDFLQPIGAHVTFPVSGMSPSRAVAGSFRRRGDSGLSRAQGISRKPRAGVRRPVVLRGRSSCRGTRPSWAGRMMTGR
jgi:hypothetical protein